MYKKIFFLGLILPIAILFLSACSDSGNDEPNSGQIPTKLTIVDKLATYKSTILVASKDTLGVDTKYGRHWKGDPRLTTFFTKQNGKCTYIGQLKSQSVDEVKTETSNTWKECITNIDVTGKVDSKTEYIVYGLNCDWRIDDGELFFCNQLKRGGGGQCFFEVPVIKGMSGKLTVGNRLTSACELLYIVNKTDKAIAFKHKGFDAEKKWYYTYAEVAVGSGTIGKTEQGEDAASDIGIITPYVGKGCGYIASFYIPNGNKIQDAQLVAEINGKEVRSVNRISSDIVLQNEHCYAIFAVWDGEKLTLGDENGEPVIHVFSDAEDAAFSVVEMEDDETMTIKTTRDNMPKVGDILASGPTEKAPYGFLCSVAAVEEADTRSFGDAVDEVILTIKKGEAYLDDILPDNNFDYTVPLDELEIDHAEDAEGNKVTILKDDEYRWKIVDISIPLKLWDNKKNDESTGLIDEQLKADFKFTYEMDPKELTFFLHTGNSTLAKWGVTYKFKSRFALDADLSLKGSILDLKDETLLDKQLTPITIPTAVPIVITPRFIIKVTANISAELKANLRLWEHMWDVASTVYYTPLTDHPYFSFDFSDEENRFFLLNSTNASIELNGDVELSAKPILTFGLYGSNLGPKEFAGGFRMHNWVGAKTSIKLKYDYTNNNVFTDYDACEVTDEASMEIGYEGEGGVYLTFFNPLKWKTSEWSYSPWKDDDLKWKGKTPMFYASFKDVEIKTLKDDYITFAATKVIPIMPFVEQDFGFCYHIDDENSSSEWKCLSLKKYYNDPYRNNNPFMTKSYPVECTLHTKDMLPNTKYVVRPYVVSNVGTKTIRILRGTAIHLKTDYNGKIGNTSIEDIPGVKLAPRKKNRR